MHGCCTPSSSSQRRAGRRFLREWIVLIDCPSGAIVLLELKTRETDRPYLSDVIELSAQRAAIALQTGEPVADHAYVAVRRPGSEAPRIHRVKLMLMAEVKALALRRQTILLGRLAPGYAGSAAHLPTMRLPPPPARNSKTAGFASMKRSSRCVAAVDTHAAASAAWARSTVPARRMNMTHGPWTCTSARNVGCGSGEAFDEELPELFGGTLISQFRCRA